MIPCSNCGTDNRSDRRFCRNCGASLALTCASCGAVNDADDRFCGSCGRPLGAAAVAGPGGVTSASGSAPQPGGGAAPVAERRVVSVLFADLVGFTTIAEGRDPEAVRDLLARYFTVAREAVERYGGTVEKFIGDAVMAVWGTPAAHEDDAERAVRAALDLVDAVAALDARGDGDREGGLRVRAAVLSGEAAVTVGATAQGMVAGDLVNTASRLQSAADPGEVLVGEATYHAARSAVAFEEVGDRALRGKALPVPAWRAIRVVAGRQGAGRSAGLEPPFVGRDDEFRLLKELLHATARESRARLVSVTGVAGIGKSRMAWELEKYVDGLVETIYWHQGRSPAYGEGVTFWALGEMVRGRARIAETDAPLESRRKLREALEEYLPDAAERAWVEPRLAALLGFEPTPPGERDELYAAWRRLFERISERGPVALVFEELQWADDGLLDFIETLLEWSRNRPIFVLTLARPELLERRQGWGAALRNFTSIHLEPLPGDAMELLLLGLAPGMPQPLIRLVRERAEGIPLYAVELVRMLVDQGRLVEREGRYHLVGDVSALQELSLPDTLQSLIGARLDNLPASERQLLQLGGVLGQSFTVEALAYLAGRSRDEVEASLRQLGRKELVVLEVDPRSPERGQYRFIQGLIRDVAYGRLARRDRSAKHLEAARYFEALEDPELAGVVASHYVQAYRAAEGTAEASGLAGRAVAALVAAADRASALYNHGQALTFLGEALEIEPDERRRIELTERAADAAFLGNQRDRALELYGGLVAWHREHGDPAAQARAMRRYGTIEIWSPDGPTTAVRYLETARDELAAKIDERDLSALEADLARAYLMAGDFPSAVATIDRALPVAERLEQLQTIAELLASKGWATAEVGRVREAIALLRGALPFTEKVGFPNAYFRTVMNFSSIGSLEVPAEALAVAQRASELAERLGYHDWSIFSAGNAAYAAMSVGDWDAALAIGHQHDREDLDQDARLNLTGPAIIVTSFRHGAPAAEALLEPMRGMRESASPQDRGFFHEVASHVELAARRFDGAFAEGMSATESPNGQFPIRGALLAGHAALWARDPLRLQDALGVLAASPPRASVSVAAERSLRAGLDVLEGRADVARTGYERSIAELDDAKAAFDAALARLERAAFLQPRDAAERAAWVADARQALDTLGARVLLDWLEEASDGGPAEERSRAAVESAG